VPSSIYWANIFSFSQDNHTKTASVYRLITAASFYNMVLFDMFLGLVRVEARREVTVEA
jgi:hypothetical protein